MFDPAKLSFANILRVSVDGGTDAPEEAPTPYALGWNRNLVGMFDTDTDVDAFSFSLEAGRTVAITLEGRDAFGPAIAGALDGLAAEAPRLSVIDRATGEEVATPRVPAAFLRGTAIAAFTAPLGGDYLVRVENAGEAPGAGLFYQLSARSVARAASGGDALQLDAGTPDAWGSGGDDTITGSGAAKRCAETISALLPSSKFMRSRPQKSDSLYKRSDWCEDIALIA